MKDIKDFDYETIETRKAELDELMKYEEALTVEKIVELTDEYKALNKRKEEIKDKVEKRDILLKEVAKATDVKIIENNQRGESKMTVEKTFDSNSVEYRNAFLKKLIHADLNEVEQRAYLHTTENTGAVVPADLVNKIYSNMEEQHPILKDVQVLRTGAVISIVKHTAIVAGDAKAVGEGEANDDEQNTFVNVALTGKDFSKHVDFSYRLGKVSIPAFEQYLVNEIGARLGAAMARDIVAQIKLDVATENAIPAATVGTLDKADLLAALGLLKGTGRVNVYTNNGTFYGAIAGLEGAEGLVSFIPNYQDAIAGQVLGKGIKQEDAVGDGELIFLDPQQFVYNIVQDVLIERDRDIKTHTHTIAGFAIAGGTLTNDKAAVVLTVGA
jgi:HK97 family phage major capsid protein